MKKVKSNEGGLRPSSPHLKQAEVSLAYILASLFVINQLAGERTYFEVWELIAWKAPNWKVSPRFGELATVAASALLLLWPTLRACISSLFNVKYVFRRLYPCHFHIFSQRIKSKIGLFGTVLRDRTSIKCLLTLCVPTAELRVVENNGNFMEYKTRKSLKYVYRFLEVTLDTRYIKLGSVIWPSWVVSDSQWIKWIGTHSLLLFHLKHDYEV